MSHREDNDLRGRELSSQIQYRLLEKLAEAGKQYREMIESLREVVFCADVDGRILFLNKAWRDILGYAVEDSMGRNAVEFVVPQDRFRILELVAALHSGADLQYGEVFGFVSADGEVRRLAISGRGRRSEHAVGLLHDITDDERVRVQLDAATDALKEREQQLNFQRRHTSLILEGVTDGIVLVDAAERVYFANLAARTMLGLGAASGRPTSVPLREVLEQGGLADATLRGQGRVEDLNDREWALERDNVLVLHLSTNSTLDEQGRLAGHMLILRDVTREREIERMKSDFVASCSHELRTPLTSILGFARRLAENPTLSDSKREQCLDIILAQSVRLQSLITGLLDLSRIDSGEFGIVPSNIDLPGFLEQCVEEARATSAEAGIGIVVELALDQEFAVLDEQMTALALQNLLSNAIKFSARGQTVALSADRKNGDLKITVRDQGIGIPKEHLPHIFERFYRVPRPSREIAGTGFGLAIVREVAERQGGSVHVQSKPGQGSTFTLHFKV